MQLDGLNVAEASIKRRDHIKLLADLKPRIQVYQQKLNINPIILFSRLIAIVQREEDMNPYFDYKLTHSQHHWFTAVLIILCINL